VTSYDRSNTSTPASREMDPDHIGAERDVREVIRVGTVGNVGVGVSHSGVMMRAFTRVLTLTLKIDQC